VVSSRLFLIGLLLSLGSGYLAVRLIYKLVTKKGLPPDKRTQHWFYLLIGFSPFYFYLSVLLIGLLLTAGGSGLIDLKM